MRPPQSAPASSGWISGSAEDDLKAFRKDLLEGVEKLRNPKGYDHMLRRVRKQLCRLATKFEPLSIACS